MPFLPPNQQRQGTMGAPRKGQRGSVGAFARHSSHYNIVINLTSISCRRWTDALLCRADIMLCTEVAIKSWVKRYIHSFHHAYFTQPQQLIDYPVHILTSVLFYLFSFEQQKWQTWKQTGKLFEPFNLFFCKPLLYFFPVCPISHFKRLRFKPYYWLLCTLSEYVDLYSA